jgi:NADP-dependent 3-hydroxy acid dehydrogenase YdfG
VRALYDRVAVVTGAASGIGRATAVALAAKGCKVALVDVDAARLLETQAHIEQGGGNASAHVVDVSDRSAMAALADEVVARYGGVHIVVNNAGVNLTEPFVRQNLDDIDWLLRINLWGVLHGCHFFLPALLAAPEGHIVNIASLAGLCGLPTQSVYCAAKAGVVAFSEALGTELTGTRVGLTVVCPGAVGTRLMQGARGSDKGFTGRMASLMQAHGMPPQRVANRIIAAIETGAPRVRVCAETYLTDWAKRLAPTWPLYLLGWFYAWAVRRGFAQGSPHDSAGSADAALRYR